MDEVVLTRACGPLTWQAITSLSWLLIGSPPNQLEPGSDPSDQSNYEPGPLLQMDMPTICQATRARVARDVTTIIERGQGHGQ
jgi:hypothetical protein